MANAAAAAAAAAAVSLLRNPKMKHRSSEINHRNSYGFYRDDDALLSSVAPARVTITCSEKGDVAGKLVALPRSFEELKEIGVRRYGAAFVRVLSEEGAEIDDIRLVRDGDRVVFGSEKRAAVSDAARVRGAFLERVTISCLEKGDANGKLVLLPRSFEELMEIGVKRYGATFVRVLNEDGAEIDDILVVRDGDRVVFTR